MGKFDHSDSERNASTVRTGAARRKDECLFRSLWNPQTSDRFVLYETLPRQVRMQRRGTRVRSSCFVTFSHHEARIARDFSSIVAADRLPEIPVLNPTRARPAATRKLT